MDTIEKALRKHQAAKEQRETEVEQADDRQSREAVAENKAGTIVGATAVESAVQASRESRTNKVSLRTDYKPNIFELDLARLAHSGIILPDEKRSKIKEEYKHIKRPLLQKASMEATQAGKENLIMVTSAYSGEGKTFSSLNLAMSIAVERDRRVLLVDADVVKPGMGRLLGLENRDGLVDFLNGDNEDLSSILLSTNVHNLTLMPAGKTHHLSHELLASKAMQDLVEELATRYKDRVIIFDSSPLLATSESRVLARLVGQVVIVIEQDKTSQTAVQDAIACIERGKITGLILNKSHTGSDAYYGYYYRDDSAK